MTSSRPTGASPCSPDRLALEIARLASSCFQRARLSDDESQSHRTGVENAIKSRRSARQDTRPCSIPVQESAYRLVWRSITQGRQEAVKRVPVLIRANVRRFHHGADRVGGRFARPISGRGCLVYLSSSAEPSGRRGSEGRRSVSSHPERSRVRRVEMPSALEPLEENRRQLLATLDLLDQTLVDVERADLASELVGICSRYEDVKDRVIYSALRACSVSGEEIDRAEEDQRVVRDALSEIRRRTQHVTPNDVHADDPEGFEEALNALIDAVRAHIEHEDNVLFPILAELDADASAELRSDVERAVAHTSTYPNPPHNPLGRAIIAVDEWIERNVHDQPTPWHPGVDALNDELARTTNDR